MKRLDRPTITKKPILEITTYRCWVSEQQAQMEALANVLSEPEAEKRIRFLDIGTVEQLGDLPRAQHAGVLAEAADRQQFR